MALVQNTTRLEALMTNDIEKKRRIIYEQRKS